MTRVRSSRRSFLCSSTTLLAVSALAKPGAGAEMPAVTHPRATDGDDSHEPRWEQRLTLTVGPDKADLVGRDDRVIQAALDYVARLGGGTVQLLPGVYTLRNAIFLPSKIRLLGSGGDAIVTKIPSRTVKLAADSDWYDQEITLEDPAGFRVGDGVLLKAKNPHHGGQDVIKRTLVAQSGRRFKLNDGLRENLWLKGEPTCASLFPLLTSENTTNVVLENLTLDGNRENNENLNGNYGGCVFLQDCSRYTLRNVTTRNYNGDGISFQVCHDVQIDSCHSHDNADLGVHPGSGSQRPRVCNCRIERNRIGLFWCWGVKYGLAEANRMEENRDYGISIGHCDTDNVMRDNVIARSGKVGVLFRDESQGADFWANRNVLEKNRILDSGAENGIGIDIQGKTKDARIVRNEIRESRGPANRTGIRIAAQAGPVELVENALSGFAKSIVDERSKG